MRVFFVFGPVHSVLSRMVIISLLFVHRYSVDIFTYSGPSGILGSGGKQNTARARARRRENTFY